MSSFSFEGLLPGACQLGVPAPPGYTPGKSVPGPAGGVGGPGRISGIKLAGAKALRARRRPDMMPTMPHDYLIATASSPSKPRLRAAAEEPEPWIARARPSASLLVLLDFDGVLHPLGREAERFSNAAALGRALDDLEREGIDSAVALTTSWRFHPWEMIRSELALRSPGLAERLEGRCGSFASRSGPGEPKRLLEALDYLRARGSLPASIAALDDQPALFGASPPDWIVACDGSTGFGPAQVDLLRAIAWRGAPALAKLRP